MGLFIFSHFNIRVRFSDIEIIEDFPYKLNCYPALVIIFLITGINNSFINCTAKSSSNATIILYKSGKKWVNTIPIKNPMSKIPIRSLINSPFTCPARFSRNTTVTIYKSGKKWVSIIPVNSPISKIPICSLIVVLIADIICFLAA